jgi:hypothetical protein
MTGGLFNIISEGKESIILIGQANKTFFTKTHQSHTNFGRQKFRINYEGEPMLNHTTSTTYNFKIPRYGDLLNQLYFSFTLPNIWSPLISIGGVPAMFCSACRTQISSKLDTTVGGVPSVYSTFVNDVSNNCHGCGCECTTQFAFTNIYRDSMNNFKTRTETATNGGMKWLNRVFPFEFKWIENLGVQILKSVRIYSNNNIIQEFTGQYLLNMVYRDFTEDQKNIFNRMIGNTNDLMNPKNYKNRNGHYPNAAYFGSMYEKMRYGLEPSIRGKKLYVPINLWSTLNNKTPIPLISMQYSELRVEIELRPVNEWWVIKNIINNISTGLSDQPVSSSEESSVIFSVSNTLTTVPIDVSNGVNPVGPAPDISGCSIIDSDSKSLLSFSNLYTSPHPFEFSIYDLKYFLKAPPPKVIIDQEYDKFGSSVPEIGALPYPININKTIERYYDIPRHWLADIHIIANYTFLTENERSSFANNCQTYLVREVHEQDIYDIVGGYNYVPIKTRGLVISWMWYFQRSDVSKRNEWSNYTNLPYNNEYNNGAFNLNGVCDSSCQIKQPLTGLINEIVWQPIYNAENTKEILLSWGLYFNSAVREIELDNGVIAWVDLYSRSNGSGIEGTYYYNFCLNTSPFNYQPSGAVNLSVFNTINWGFRLNNPSIITSNTPNVGLNEFIQPILSQPKIVVSGACDPLSNTNNPVVLQKNITDLYLWNYTLHIMEERYNILVVKNGIAGLAFDRTT